MENNKLLNAVIVDNFTFYSALRAINHHDSRVTTIPVTASSYKVVFDLASLAMLVELLLFHDELYTDSTTLIWEQPELRELVKPLPFKSRELFVRKAIEKALSEKFVSMSIWQTDHVDEENFESEEDFWPQVAEPHKVVEGLPLELPVIEILGTYGGARDHDIVMAAEVAPNIDHHAIKPLGFLLGAYYYDLISQSCGLPYVPHILRSPLIAYDLGRQTGLDSRSIARHLTAIISEVRHTTADTVNKYFGTEVFDLHVPVILASLIKQATRPEDVLSGILKLRETAAGKALRKWMAELLDVIAEGDLAAVSDRIDDLRRLALNLGGPKRSEAEGGVITLSIGPLTIDPLKTGIGSFFQRNLTQRQLRILRFLSERVLKLKAIVPELRRVFGDEVAAAVTAYPALAWRDDFNAGPYRTYFGGKSQ